VLSWFGRIEGAGGAMVGILRFILGNFPFTFLVIGLIASCVKLLFAPKPLTGPVIVEALFSYFLLFSIGFSLFYNFVLHTFFGEMTAGYIGWEMGDREMGDSLALR
jgi:hypothetical protein